MKKLMLHITSNNFTTVYTHTSITRFAFVTILGSNIILRFCFFFSRFDFDDAAFSPPSYDDSFYVRYQKSQKSELPKEGLKRIVPENNITSSTNQITKEKSISDLKEAKIDFSKHPLPCQPFISAVDSKGIIY